MKSQSTYNRSIAATVMLGILAMLTVAAVTSSANHRHPTSPSKEMRP